MDMTRPRTRSSSSQGNLYDNFKQNKAEVANEVKLRKEELRTTQMKQPPWSSDVFSKNDGPASLDADEHEYEDSDLNSSPIRRFSPKNYQISSQFDISHSDKLLSSSPIKKKKSVAFSDDLVLDVPSSPGINITPRKSILKPHNTNKELSSKNNQRSLINAYNSKELSPSDPNFWIAGCVIQLIPGSQELVDLSEGCIKVLSQENFDKRFEVYATLNNILRSNSKDVLLKLFTIPVNNFKSPAKYSPGAKSTASGETSNICKLSDIIQQDIIRLENDLFADIEEESENISQSTKADPFRIRTISQAMKLMNFILVDPDLNNFVSLENIKWFYEHCCTMIVKQTLSKALVSSYLVLIKDCRLGNKRKKLVFENSGLPEKILHSVISMKWFPSASIITEKFTAFRNLIINFPGMMAKNINHWFHILLFNVATNTSPIYMKAASVGVQALLEASRNYLNSKNILEAVRRLLENPIPIKIKSFITDLELDDIGDSKEMVTIHYLIHTLEILIENGQYKLAMDIWVAITLLSADKENGFESWKFLPQWLKVHKLCFNVQENTAKLIALSSWKAIVYNICQEDLGNLRKVVDPIPNNSNKKPKQLSINNILRPKLKLLMHILLNVTAIENQNEIIDVLNDIFLSIIYTLLNPLLFKSTTKYIHIYWDKIIQPVLLNFYFKKDSSTLYMNDLGLKFLTRLLKTSMPINDRNFNDLRCLANDSVSLAEINSIPSRWVFLKFDKILQNIILVFQSKVDVEHKMNFFNLFLNNIKLFTKKEIKTSSTSFDIIDNLPYVLETFFKHTEITYERAFKIIINLHDTFDPSMMVYESIGEEESDLHANLYSVIFRNCMPILESSKMVELMNLIFSSVNDKKFILLLSDLIKSDVHRKYPYLQNPIISAFNSRLIEISNSEYLIYRDICRVIELDFEILVKKLLQSIVTISDVEERKKVITMIDVKSWTLPIFKYFLLLVKDTSSNYLQEYSKKLIPEKFQNNEEFLDIIKYLVANSFDSYLFSMKDTIISKGKEMEGFLRFDFNQSWKEYLSRVVQAEVNYSDIDTLLFLTFKETEIEIISLIRNKWDLLPLLKEEWLRYNEQLYYDETLLKLQEQETKTNLSADDVTMNETNDLNGESPEILNQNDSQVRINDDEVKKGKVPSFGDENITYKLPNHVDTYEEVSKGKLCENIPSEPLSANKSTEMIDKKKSKVATPKGRGKKKTRKPKDNHECSANIDNTSLKIEQNENGNSLSGFDIHSFTALVTQKLSTPSPPKKAGRKKRQSKASLEIQSTQSIVNNDITSKNSMPIPETPTKSNVNINPIDETKNLAIIAVDNQHNDIAKDSNSIAKYNYSEIMQNGFKNEESRISCEDSPILSKRSSPELDFEKSPKRQKIALADYNVNLSSGPLQNEKPVLPEVNEMFISTDNTSPNESKTEDGKNQIISNKPNEYESNLHIDLFKKSTDSDNFDYDYVKSKDVDAHESNYQVSERASNDSMWSSDTMARNIIDSQTLHNETSGIPSTENITVNDNQKENEISDSHNVKETNNETDRESTVLQNLTDNLSSPSNKIDSTEDTKTNVINTSNEYNLDNIEFINKSSQSINMLTLQLNELSDEDLAEMTYEEKYNLETSMMRFMLRMRNCSKSTA